MEQQEMVDPWRQPFPQIKPFRNGMAATSSFFAKQALSNLCLATTFTVPGLPRDGFSRRGI